MKYEIKNRHRIGFELNRERPTQVASILPKSIIISKAHIFEQNKNN